MRGCDGDHKSYVSLVAMTGVAGHVGSFRKGPLDLGGGEAFGKLPLERGCHSYDTGVFPVSMVAGVVF